MTSNQSINCFEYYIIYTTRRRFVVLCRRRRRRRPVDFYISYAFLIKDIPPVTKLTKTVCLSVRFDVCILKKLTGECS